MERREGNSYRIKWFYNIIKHGLFWHGVRNRLARIGLDIMPYYWVVEGERPMKSPTIKDDQMRFDLVFLNEKEINTIQEQIIGINHKDLIAYLREGQLCIGLKHNDTIAAYMFAKKEHYTFRGRTFNFESHEAYLHSMYTFEAYRGLGLAPYLRYQSYTLLNGEGINTFYSVSEYFNKATIRFKRKLNAEHRFLYLSVVLFKRFNWNFKLKSYH